MDAEIRRLSPRTHLSETCPECGGEGYHPCASGPVKFGLVKCQPCTGSGRVVRGTHDAGSSLEAPTEYEFRIAQLEVELGVMRGQRDALLDAARRAKDCLGCALLPDDAGVLHHHDCVGAYGGECRAWCADSRAALSALSAVLGGVEGSRKLPANSDLTRAAQAVRDFFQLSKDATPELRLNAEILARAIERGDFDSLLGGGR